MKALLKFFGVIALGLPVALLRGLVLRDMWHWFVTPLGVPEIGIVQAIGLIFVVVFVTLRGKDIADLTKPPAKDHNPFTIPLNSIAISLFIWLFAWIWSLFL